MRYLLAFLVLLAAACEPIRPYATACDSRGENCIQFFSPEEHRVWNAEQELLAEYELKAHRKALAKYPVDYREIVFTVLYDYLGPEPADDPLPIRYFVTILGDDLDLELAARLKNVGIVLEPGSEYESAKATKERDQSTTVSMLVDLHIGRIEQVESDIYRVAFGYYCGMLCAASMDAFVQCDSNRCRLLKSETHWIS